MGSVDRWRWCALVAVLALVAPAGASATFPGDNGLIAFQNDSVGGIYTINPDGSERTRLGDGFEPGWSPSGKRIAFVKNTSGGIGNTELFTMKSNGSDKQQVTHSAGSEWEPAYSADGKRIVYRVGRYRSAGGKLYTIPAGGGARKKLGTGENPDWSVETQGAAKGLIAYADADAPDPCFGSIELFTQTPAGGDRTLLPFGCETAFLPSWSPEGDELAFTSYPPVGNSDIYIGLPSGDMEAKLTDLPGQDEGPAWSPDETQVAFDDDGLWIVDVTAPLTESAIPHTANVDGALPDWQSK